MVVKTFTTDTLDAGYITETEWEYEGMIIMDTSGTTLPVREQLPIYMKKKNKTTSESHRFEKVDGLLINKDSGGTFPTRVIDSINWLSNFELQLQMHGYQGKIDSLTYPKLIMCQDTKNGLKESGALFYDVTAGEDRYLSGQLFKATELSRARFDRNKFACNYPQLPHILQHIRKAIEPTPAERHSLTLQVESLIGQTLDLQYESELNDTEFYTWERDIKTNLLTLSYLDKNIYESTRIRLALLHQSKDASDCIFHPVGQLYQQALLSPNILRIDPDPQVALENYLTQMQTQFTQAKSQQSTTKDIKSFFTNIKGKDKKNRRDDGKEDRRGTVKGRNVRESPATPNHKCKHCEKTSTCSKDGTCHNWKTLVCEACTKYRPLVRQHGHLTHNCQFKEKYAQHEQDKKFNVTNKQALSNYSLCPNNDSPSVKLKQLDQLVPTSGSQTHEIILLSRSKDTEQNYDNQIVSAVVDSGSSTIIAPNARLAKDVIKLNPLVAPSIQGLYSSDKPTHSGILDAVARTTEGQYHKLPEMKMLISPNAKECILSQYSLQQHNYSILANKNASKIITPNGDEIRLKYKNKLPYIELRPAQETEFNKHTSLLSTINETADEDAESDESDDGNQLGESDCRSTNDTEYVLMNNTGLPTTMHPMEAHHKFGHVTFNRLDQIAQVHGITLSPSIASLNGVFPKCYGCIAGKMSQKQHSKTRDNPTTNDINQEFALDLPGRKSPSNNKDCYECTIRDTHSKVFKVYHSPQRTDEYLTSHMRKWRNFKFGTTPTPPGIRILCDGEFNRGQFKQLVEGWGWTIHCSAPKDKASNGSAEAGVKIAVEGTRALLASTNLTNKFWTDASKHNCALYNNRPRLRSPAPMTVEGRPLESYHCQRFGCLVASHKPDFTKGDFTPKANFGIFLGFDEDYVYGTAKIFSLHTGRIIHSRTLQFFDHILPYARPSSMYVAQLQQLARQGTSKPIWSADDIPFTSSTSIIIPQSQHSVNSNSSTTKEASNPNRFKLLLYDDEDEESDETDSDDDETAIEDELDINNFDQEQENKNQANVIIPPPQVKQRPQRMRQPPNRYVPSKGDGKKPIEARQTFNEKTSEEQDEALQYSTGPSDSEDDTLELNQDILNEEAYTQHTVRSLNDIKEVIRKRKAMLRKAKAAKITFLQKAISANRGEIARRWMKHLYPMESSNTEDPTHDEFTFMAEQMLSEIDATPEDSRVYMDPLQPLRIPVSDKDLASMPEYDRMMWTRAVTEEMNGMKTNNVLLEKGRLPRGASKKDEEKLLEGKRAISVKKVFTLKSPDGLGRIRVKMRLVARGFQEILGEDERWDAPTIMPAILKMMTIIGLTKNATFKVFDIRQAFLKAPIDDKEIYIKIIQEDGSTVYYLLLKSLYGLKSSPGRWHTQLSKDLTNYGMKQFPYNRCLYSNGKTHIGIHVDDGLITTVDDDGEKLLEYLRSIYGSDSVEEVSMKDERVRFLGSHWTHDSKSNTCKIDQTEDIDKLVESAGLKDSKPISIPVIPNSHLFAQHNEGKDPQHQAQVGSLLWLLNTRPDISWAVKELSRHNLKNGKQHREYRNQVLRYLNATRIEGITLRPDDLLNLSAWVDSSYAECQDTRRSSSGFVIGLGTSSIFWKAFTQPSVATSSCEAELYGVFECMLYTEFFRKVMAFLGSPQESPTVTHVDSQSAQKLLSRDSPGNRSKHVDVRYFRIKESLDNKQIQLAYEPTETLIADALTKALPRIRFMELIKPIMNGRLKPRLIQRNNLK